MAYEILIENLQRLAARQGISLNTVLVQSGAGKNFVSNINKGSDPSTDKVTKLADYFEVSTDYLLGRTDQKEKPTPVSESELSDKDARLLAWFHSLPPEKRQAILTVGDGPEGLA